jgi:hypothetical protein
MRFPWLVLTLLLLPAAPIWADSITLVTGETVTGTIKSQTDSEVTIDVPVSASITDERVIRKEDISKIVKEQPDEIAYKQLAALQPNPQMSYSSETYDQILNSLNAFEAQYPNSTYLPEVTKLAAAFQDEKKRVDAGELKYLGQWLSKDEAARRRIQIVAQQIYGTMAQQAAAGEFVPAMQTFATLEQDYSATRSYPAGVTLAIEVLTSLKQDLVTRMANVKADQDQLKKTIDFTAEPEKSNIIAEAKAEDDRAAAVITQALNSGSKWVPLIPRSQLSIETLQKTTDSELGRLRAVPVESMNRSIEKVDEARNAISAGDFKTASTLLSDATGLWAQNEAAHYWGDRLKEKMATPTPTPTPTATPKPLPTPPPHPTPPPAAIAAAPAPAPAEDTPFYKTVPGAIGLAAGILILGGIAASYGQKKARKAAGAE